MVEPVLSTFLGGSIILLMRSEIEESGDLVPLVFVLIISEIVKSVTK